MIDDRPTGEDIVEDVDVTSVADDTVYAPIDELDCRPRQEEDCNHVFRTDEGRIFAVEPAPHRNCWLCCPRCGIQQCSVREHSIPQSIRERMV